MSFFKYLRKVSAVLGRIASASPEIISVFTSYKQAKSDGTVTLAEMIDLFERLKAAIIKIYPDFKIYE
jgi:hypothetical protein